MKALVCRETFADAAETMALKVIIEVPGVGPGGHDEGNVRRR